MLTFHEIDATAEVIYMAGLYVSLVTLLAAILLLLAFQRLRQLISTKLHLSYLSAFLLLTVVRLIQNQPISKERGLCEALVIILEWSRVASAAWLLCESVLLSSQSSRPLLFQKDACNKWQIVTFSLLAWFLSLVVTLIWALVATNAQFDVFCSSVYIWRLEYWISYGFRNTLNFVSLLFILFAISQWCCCRDRWRAKNIKRTYKYFWHQFFLCIISLGLLVSADLFLLTRSPLPDGGNMEEIARLRFAWTALHSTQGLVAAACVCFFNPQVWNLIGRAMCRSGRRYEVNNSDEEEFRDGDTKQLPYPVSMRTVHPAIYL